MSHGTFFVYTIYNNVLIVLLYLVLFYFVRITLCLVLPNDKPCPVFRQDLVTETHWISPVLCCLCACFVHLFVLLYVRAGFFLGGGGGEDLF